MNYSEGSFRVDALRILIASAVVGQTLVDVPAEDAVAGEPLATATLVAALRVDAVGVSVTVEGSE